MIKAHIRAYINRGNNVINVKQFLAATQGVNGSFIQAGDIEVADIATKYSWPGITNDCKNSKIGKLNLA